MIDVAFATVHRPVDLFQTLCFLLPFLHDALFKAILSIRMRHRSVGATLLLWRMLLLIWVCRSDRHIAGLLDLYR